MSNNDQIKTEDIKQRLEELKREIIVPEPSNWDCVQAEIVKQSKRKWFVNSVKKGISIAAACVVLFALVTSQNSNVSAGFKSFYKKISDGFVQIFIIGDSQPAQDGVEMLTPPPDLYNLTLNIESKNNLYSDLISEKGNISDSIATYLPDGFKLDNSSSANTADHSTQYNYINEQNQYIAIIKEQYMNKTEYVLDVELDYEYYTENLINNNRAVINTNSKGITIIEWVDNNSNKYLIISNFELEELLKVAHSIK